MVQEVESLHRLQDQMKVWKKLSGPEAEVKMTKSHHEPQIRKAKAVVTEKALTGEEPDPPIPKEYWDLGHVFSERESDVLLPQCPTECAIEIVLGAKLPKLKLYLMMSPEMEIFRLFIDKNLDRRFIQLTKSHMAAPVDG